MQIHASQEENHSQIYILIHKNTPSKLLRQSSDDEKGLFLKIHNRYLDNMHNYIHSATIAPRTSLNCEWKRNQILGVSLINRLVYDWREYRWNAWSIETVVSIAKTVVSIPNRLTDNKQTTVLFIRYFSYICQVTTNKDQ